MNPFHHSHKDALLVALSALGLATQIAGCLLWNSGHFLMSGLLAVTVPFLICTNYQCISHNFIHNPFFRNKLANRIFSQLNSLSLGIPQTLYKYHHLNHHQFNNDAKDPVTGQTSDHSSIYRRSKHLNRPESILSYALVGVWRTDLGSYYRTASGRQLAYQVWIELIYLVCFYALLMYLSPTYTCLWLLPAWYLGQALALAENYLEHYGADPHDIKANSVSCYNPIYNFIWFNNGYHQEHHCSPRVHWTLIPKQRLLNGRHRIVPYCHIATLFRAPMAWSHDGAQLK